jgi:hypothetical protein
VALAVGLAFGLGGRDVASRVTESWYANGQAAAQRVRTNAEGQERRQGRGTSQATAATAGTAAPAGTTLREP